MKPLVVSLAFNLVLAGALALTLLAPRQPAVEARAAEEQREPSTTPKAIGTAIDAPARGTEAGERSCAATAAELVHCRALVAKLDTEVSGHDYYNLDKVFEGGEPNQALTARVRAFFPAGTAVECHDVVCNVVEQGDDEELLSTSERLLRDPFFRAMVAAERLGAAADGKVQRTIKVKDTATDGEAVLEYWLGVNGPEALLACDAPPATRLKVQLHIDDQARISVDVVEADPVAVCVKERLRAAVPKGATPPVRAAGVSLVLPPSSSE